MKRYLAAFALTVVLTSLGVAFATAQPSGSAHKIPSSARVSASKHASARKQFSRRCDTDSQKRTGSTCNDDPTLSPSGDLWDLRNQYVNGNSSVSLGVNASDAKYGIVKAWVESEGVGVIDSQDAQSTPSSTEHHRCTHSSSHSGRRCRKSFSFTTSVSMSLFPEGANTFTEKATNTAGRTGETSWRVYVDRTPPSIPENTQLLTYDASSNTAAVGWDDSSDPSLQDGSPGSGLVGYEYRWQVDGGGWSTWTSTPTSEASLTPVTPGATVNLEVRAVDTVGNVSDVGTNTASTSDISEPGLQVSAQIPDYSSEPSLTSSQSGRSVDLALADARLTALTDGHLYSIGKPEVWTNSSGALIGATLSINFTNPAASISGYWPSIFYDESETSDASIYQTYLAEYTATSVPRLDVSVDLNCGSVVSIAPGGEADVDQNSVTIASKPVRHSCQVSGQTQEGSSSVSIRQSNISRQSRLIRNTRAISASLAAQGPMGPTTWIRNVRIVTFGSDSFYNYDFHKKSSLGASNTFNPLNLIFWGNSAIWKFDTQLYTFGTGASQYTSSPQYGRLRQGHGWIWDSDRGYKDRITCGTDDHYRVYHDANPTKNIYLGYFLIGGAHQDKGDIPYLCGTARYGWQELAEQKVADEATRVFGATAVLRNRVFLNNYVTPHWENNHYESNSGKATKIHVCLNQFDQKIKCGGGGGQETY
jgi:hypothetical protein